MKSSNFVRKYFQFKILFIAKLYFKYGIERYSKLQKSFFSSFLKKLLGDLLSEQINQKTWKYTIQMQEIDPSLWDASETPRLMVKEVSGDSLIE